MYSHQKYLLATAAGWVMVCSVKDGIYAGFLQLAKYPKASTMMGKRMECTIVRLTLLLNWMARGLSSCPRLRPLLNTRQNRET